MGAFNILKYPHVCPACNKESVLYCQTHIASSYDGDEGGRFYDREYEPGQRLRWWAAGDSRYSEWRQGDYGLHSLPEDADIECCYSTCALCDAELYAVVKFEDCRFTEVLDTGLEQNWPDGFSK